jgi:membrane protein required for colicin V production
MNAADYLLLVIVLISALVGIWRGFLREAIALVTWLAALIIAWQFGGSLEPVLGGLLSSDDVRPWAARAIIFIVVLLVGAGIGSVVNYFVRLSIFSHMDRFLGGLFGALRGVVVAGVLALLGQLLELNTEDWWERSLLVPYAMDVGEMLQSLTGETLEAARREASKI